MIVISIDPNQDGSHDIQVYSADVPPVTGFAVIPDGMELPDTFPFVGVEAENGTVTRLTPGVVPEPPEPTPEPTPAVSVEDVVKSMLGG